MFLNLFSFRRLLATSFLFVFVNVFVGQCWCATVNPGVVAPHPAELAHHEKPAHPGCHGHGAQAEPHGRHKGHSSKSTTSHDCCKDKSASLLSSLMTPAQKQLMMPALALLPAAMAFHSRPQAGQWDRTAAVTLVPPGHLKPKILDTCIFIQSLTV
ncbi:hypothetical protein [Hymenobacter siberiensis]|uniref:hypothetical protein n=1 Tax=Hymenobacter siberiensis TaxID=2848396 RepID=UPI001C1E31F1|nr:hypothetical protein [Hymenobacter siberiensis]